MHRILVSNGKYRHSRLLCVLQTLGYLSLAVSGFLIVISPAFHSLASDIVAAFLMIGGLSAMMGSVTRRWLGEFVGLPLTAAALGVLGIYSWRSSIDTVPYIAWANLILFISYGALILARWRMVLAIYRTMVWLCDKHDLSDETAERV